MPSTNFFHVKDVLAFLKWVAETKLRAVPGAGSDSGKFSILPEATKGRFYSGGEDQRRFLASLSSHLSKDSVARVDNGEAVCLAFPRGLIWRD